MSKIDPSCLPRQQNYAEIAKVAPMRCEKVECGPPFHISLYPYDILPSPLLKVSTGRVLYDTRQVNIHEFFFLRQVHLLRLPGSTIIAEIREETLN